jgi:hypothetical protein
MAGRLALSKPDSGKTSKADPAKEKRSRRDRGTNDAIPEKPDISEGHVNCKRGGADVATRRVQLEM